MKKVLLTTIFAVMLISSAVFYSSCNKEEKQFNNAIKGQTVGEPSNSFTNPKEHIGIMHNIQLQYVFENLDTIPNFSEALECIENILITGFYPLETTLNLEAMPDIDPDLSSFDVQYWLSNFTISNQLKLEVSNTISIIQNALTLGEIISSITEKEENAHLIFSGTDLDLYYEHLAVAKHTSIFWFPSNQGGLNGIQFLDLDNLNSDFDFEDTYSEVNWWKVLTVDCIGGMATGPVGYVAGSAIATVMQL
jgi:hypothetical protein